MLPISGACEWIGVVTVAAAIINSKIVTGREAFQQGAVAKAVVSGKVHIVITIDYPVIFFKPVVKFDIDLVGGSGETRCIDVRGIDISIAIVVFIEHDGAIRSVIAICGGIPIGIAVTT